MLNKKMIIGLGVLTVSAVAAGIGMLLHKKKAMIEVVNDETDEFEEEEVEVLPEEQ